MPVSILQLFLGVGDAVLEEEVVARAVSSGISAAAFGAEMDELAAKKTDKPSIDIEFDALFGDYTGMDHSEASEEIVEEDDRSQPRSFSDTFTYANVMPQRLVEPFQEIFKQAPHLRGIWRLYGNARVRSLLLSL